MIWCVTLNGQYMYNNHFCFQEDFPDDKRKSPDDKRKSPDDKRKSPDDKRKSPDDKRKFFALPLI